MAEVQPDGQDSLTGETALTVAACNGCHSVCTALLSRGANVAIPNQKVNLCIHINVEGYKCWRRIFNLFGK